MLIGITGLPQSGKKQLLNFLIQNKNFSVLPNLTSSDILPFMFSDNNWAQDFCFTCNDNSIITALKARPFFVLIHVTASLLVRFERSGLKELFDFALAEESLTQHHTPHIDITITNNYTTINDFYSYLVSKNITNPELLRPSNCMKRRVGCLLVKNNRILATGYNGTPRNIKNCNEGGCIRCNSNQVSSDECLCIHAEENALLEAGRERIQGDTILYCTTHPCLGCAKKIVQCGVKEVVYKVGYRSGDTKSKDLMEEGGVIVRQYSGLLD